MRRAADRILAAAVAIGATLAIGWGSAVDYPIGRDGDAVLRLSWRLRGERVEECRRLSPAELESLPPHMRRPEVCEGRLIPYRLVVVVDGDTVAEERIRGAGARHDRPIYVYREVAVRAGRRHDIVVGFAPVVAGARDTGDAASARDAGRVEAGEHAEGAEDGGEGTGYGLKGRIRLEANEVALVTLDPDRNRLILRRPR